MAVSTQEVRHKSYLRELPAGTVKFAVSATNIAELNNDLPALSKALLARQRVYDKCHRCGHCQIGVMGAEKRNLAVLDINELQATMSGAQYMAYTATYTCNVPPQLDCPGGDGRKATEIQSVVPKSSDKVAVW